ncbi:hypothetical protein EGW08_007157 [Elysia chlorotica]|uniref:Uncharacterized protein n=1 Tax=Elysia chlorotica TaxID=188477 RepID=A0A433TU25_ELYCH|nr:hypothetical protein EGW08_007157 [Elysia chlorotica]
MGCSHLQPEDNPRTESDGGRQKNGFGTKRFVFEAEVEPEFLEDVVETDNPGHGEEKEKLLISVAEKLMLMGDDLQSRKEEKERKEIEQISKEIGDYIKQVMAPDIEQRMGPRVSRSSATSVLQEAGVLSLVYGVFKKKVENLLGPGEDMGQLALVTSITRGVASGLQHSSSGIAGLLATVSTKYVQEKFGTMLNKSGSLTKIISEETAPPGQ